MKTKILRSLFALALSLPAFGQVASLMPEPCIQFSDSSGVPLTGGKIYTYLAGTSTPAPTYTDSSALILNTNPVILDSAGVGCIWLGPISYKIVLKDMNDAQQRTVDNVSNNISAGAVNVAGNINALTYSVAGGPLDSTDLADTLNIARYNSVGVFLQPQSLAMNGVFTSTQDNLYMQSLLGGINVGTEIQTLLGGNHTTTALAGGMAVPAGAGVLNAQGVAGVVSSNCNSLLETVCNTIAGYFQARGIADGAAVWGANVVASDLLTAPNVHIRGEEIDINTYATPALVYGWHLTGILGGTMPANSYMMLLNPQGTQHFYNGLAIADGMLASAGNQFALNVGAASASGASISSNKLVFPFFDSASAEHNAQEYVDGRGLFTFGQGLVVLAAAPTCAFTSGFGTGPATCTLDTGSTNQDGIIIMTTGTGSPGATGTATLTFTNFSNAFGVNKPVCMYQASDDGGAWVGSPAFKDKTPSVLSDLFTWTNAAVTLSTSTAYKINYHCWAK